MTISKTVGLPERWILPPSDQALVMAKHQASRLGFAVLLIFFREHGRFPRIAAEIEPAAVDVIAQQITVESPASFAMALSGRTVERHRAEIRARFGFREASIADADGLESWLHDQATATGTDPDALVARLETRCRDLLRPAA